MEGALAAVPFPRTPLFIRPRRRLFTVGEHRADQRRAVGEHFHLHAAHRKADDAFDHAASESRMVHSTLSTSVAMS
jgi:hypothetical protein